LIAKDLKQLKQEISVKEEQQKHEKDKANSAWKVEQAYMEGKIKSLEG